MFRFSSFSTRCGFYFALFCAPDRVEVVAKCCGGRSPQHLVLPLLFCDTSKATLIFILILPSYWYYYIHVTALKSKFNFDYLYCGKWVSGNFHKHLDATFIYGSVCKFALRPLINSAFWDLAAKVEYFEINSSALEEVLAVITGWINSLSKWDILRRHWNYCYSFLQCVFIINNVIFVLVIYISYHEYLLFPVNYRG